MIFTLHGKVKPYTRMTQRGKWASPQAQEYLDSQHALGLQLRHQMAEHGWEMLPGQTPLRVRMHFEFPGGMNNMDLDNLIKSILDSANGVVYPDDRWINKIEASRVSGVSEYQTTFEVEVLK
jgi:Holliday junction resolvase RusA-like endonuclease